MLEQLPGRISKLERDMRGEVSAAALIFRVGALEMDTSGQTSSGPLLERITALEVRLSHSRAMQCPYIMYQQMPFDISH